MAENFVSQFKDPHTPLSSTTGLSSNEHFVDAQQHQLSQQQQHPTASSLSSSSQPQPQPQQHPHFYGQQSAGVRLPPLQTSSDVALGGSPVFDARHQHPATPIDFADAAAVSRSQSQRFDPSVHHLTQQHQQQHPQVYGIASGSIDDLPGTASYQPSPIATNAPEKRSTRKLFKGIFGSGRSSHDPAPQQQHGHAHQVSYDNTAGLARRPSKRVSNPPIKTGSLPPATQQQQPPSGSDRDWYQGPPSQQPSPLHDLGEVDEYPYSAQESNAHIPPQDSRLVYPSTTIRQVSREHLDTSPYDEELYQAPDHLPHQLQQHHQQLQHQPQPLQRQGTLHGQDQQILYEPQQQQSQQQQPPPPPQQQTATYDLQPPPSHQQQQFHHGGNSPQAPYQPGQEPRIVTSHFGLQQNPETISQLSHESPVTDPDQRSANQQQSAQSSPAVHYASAQDLDPSLSTPKLPPIQVTNNQGQTQQQSAMAPPGGASAPSRRLDNDKALRGQVEPPPGPPPGYRQGGVPMNSMSPLPPPHGQGGPQNPAYRSDRASQYEGSGVVEQGRNSPQPSNADRDVDPDKQFKDLLTKYKNVKRLYFDGKSQIEQLTSQVETLQNAVANQRMSASRTAWDDNEYTTRFNRLNGAINNLAFNIRKDWRSLPQWLEGYVSADALKTGKQEMTAVGRAIVSRWLVEEIFNKCFHPALDPQLSSQLKEIELSIRGNAYTMHSQEEFDALTTKVVNWRMATLDGLQKKFNSTTTDNRTMFTSKATSDLTTHLYQHLTSPPPAGVEGSTSMIAELAVAIASNLPLESRDVAIMYPLPGETVQPHLMEVEKTGLPALENQKSEVDAGGDDDDDEPDKDKDKNGRVRGDKAKAGLPNDAGKVRLAGFVALEVRGRQVLIKAPVWTV
ncbi:S-adenosylmethionine-dependent methyltransferase-like protein [Purpureocillium lilacinum]|uniref:S-adenosylmethionine-dependent methyltransferase-like protein n=1 Tax=Purpureocillium lilacinum TaxID=33203 RepID=A0A179HXD0_PURLI|nr:S-adenosylmethionine-dependent methyltransferase-like protein [Purpureocillium lilacinum]OAQ95047.1 S-adenosylmethionine-dependent methyltransferase-like protein [Purpureocillium lilacinum]